jgi:hypothetical protein
MARPLMRPSERQVSRRCGLRACAFGPGQACPIVERNTNWRKAYPRAFPTFISFCRLAGQRQIWLELLLARQLTRSTVLSAQTSKLDTSADLPSAYFPRRST